MRRVISAFNKKYVLKEEYRNFGVYQEISPSGILISQSFLITNGDIEKAYQSYENKIVEEMLDIIDDYLDKGKEIK